MVVVRMVAANLRPAGSAEILASFGTAKLLGEPFPQRFIPDALTGRFFLLQFFKFADHTSSDLSGICLFLAQHTKEFFLRKHRDFQLASFFQLAPGLFPGKDVACLFRNGGSQLSPVAFNQLCSFFPAHGGQGARKHKGAA